MRNRLVSLVEQAPPDRMLTLTVDTKAYRDPLAAARRMGHALPALIRKMRAWLKGGALEYLAVWERTRAGWPHLHVLIRGPFLPQRLVSDWWNELTRSPVVYFTLLNGSRAGARYVTKYLTKDPDPFGSGRALRTSRGFLVEPMRPQGQRACTLGPLKVYEGTAWEWLSDQLADLRLVDVADDGTCLSAPWSVVDAPELVVWWRWERQGIAVGRFERPPPPPGPLHEGPLWTVRPAPARAA
jgi:hypothetical protein